jgi:hypothetical protein
MKSDGSKARRSLYGRWFHMKGRCLNPKEAGYPRYGGRGIRVCARWRDSFDAFLLDVGIAPDPNMSIDRADNNAHYSCGKCEECLVNGWRFNLRWATRREQQSNLSNNVFVTHNGETLTIAEWARRSPAGVSHAALWRRLFVSKWDMERALNTPNNTNPETERRDGVYITVNGVRYRAKEYARISGIPYLTVYKQQTRDEIKQLQKDLKGGLEEAGRLRAEIAKLRVRSKRIGDD